MYHAAAQYFNPAFSFAHPAALTAARPAGNVNFRARLCKRKMMRPQTDFRFRSEHVLRVNLERSLEIAHRNALVYHQAFYLVENRRVCRVYVVRAVYLSGANDFYRRLLLFHDTDLHRGGLRSEQHFVRNVKGVLCVPRRMAFREIQRLEVIIVEFNFRAVGDLIAHADEQVLHFVADLMNRMQGSCSSCLPGHRHVYGFLLQLQPKSGGFQFLRFFCDALLYIGAHLIHELSGGRPFLRAQLSHSLQKRRQRALLSQIRHFQLIQPVQPGHRCDPRFKLFLNGIQLILHIILILLIYRKRFCNTCLSGPAGAGGIAQHSDPCSPTNIGTSGSPLPHTFRHAAENNWPPGTARILQGGIRRKYASSLRANA